MKIKFLIITLFSLGAFNNLQAQTEIRGTFGDTLNITLAQVRGEITWQSSLDSINWVDINGATSENLMHIPSMGSSWLRALVQEQNCPIFIEGPYYLEFQDTLGLNFHPEVIVMDTVQLVGISDSIGISQGNFRFIVPNSNAEDVLPGDYIVGLEDAGYLRKVDSWILQDDTLTVVTSEASIDEVLDDATGNFTISVDSLESRSTGFSYIFNQTQIGSLGPLTLSINSGSLEAQGDYSGELQLSLDNGLEYFNFTTNNLVITSNSEIELTAQGSVNIVTDAINLAKYKKLFYFQLGLLPVVGMLEADLLGIYSADVGAELNVQGNLNSTSNISINISYTTQDGWLPQVSVDSYNELTLDSPSGQANATVGLVIQPVVKLSFYNVVVPYIKAGLNTEITGTVASPELNWDIQGSAFVNAEIGVEDLRILSETIASFAPITFQSSSVHLKTPYQIELVSGNNQSGEVGEQLSEPVIVKVKDQLGFTQSNVPVKAVVTSGDGTLETDEVLTDENGEAQFMWTLGEDPEIEQGLEITAKDGSLEHLLGSPISIVAEFGGCGVDVQDIDGNVYETVSIGDQCWFKSNLRTTTFSDGTPITNGNVIETQDYWEWLGDQTYPQYNSQSGSTLYGNYYNVLCALDSRNVCPTGWHAATYSDAVLLVSYLGGESAAGPQLTSTLGWDCPTGATNETGFTALPSGYIWTDNIAAEGWGPFIGLQGCYTGWWIPSGAYSSSGNPILRLNAGSALIEESAGQGGEGFNIRCVKDN